jgi:hypothetical protein
LTDNIPQYAQRFVQEKLTKENRFALPPEQTNHRMSILPASWGGSIAEKGSHFFDFARRLTNAEPFPYLRWGLFWLTPVTPGSENTILL